MKRRRPLPWPVLAALLLSSAALAAAVAKLPVIGGEEAVASVNGEPITLEEMTDQLDLLHQSLVEAPAGKVHKPNPSALLERLINAKLILQEARRIGLDQLPEVQERMKSIRLRVLKDALVQQQVGDVTTPDPKDVEKIYRDAVKELTLTSVVFGKEADAKTFVAAIRAGGGFDALADKALKDGKAKGIDRARTMKASDLPPQVADAAATLKPGEASAPIPLPEGAAVVRLLKISYPENPEARMQAEKTALKAKKQAKLDEYMNYLRKQYTKVNQQLLKSLDYESKEPGLARLRADTRVLATIQGDEPVLVKDLTARLEKEFYHGLDDAIQRKRVNSQLPRILDRLLLERVTLLEGKRLKIDRTEAFKNRQREQVDGLLFDTFLKKVIHPEIKMNEAEVRKYYDEHSAEYETPGMVRMEGLAFTRKEDATAALDKLRKGAELKWMKSNATGQADRKSFPDLLDLKGELVVVSTLPEGMRKAVEGASAGDLRLYAAPGGPFYVLSIRQVAKAEPRPYDAVRSEIAGKVFALKRQDAVDDYAAKLRAASQVKIFAQGDALNEILGLQSAGGK